MTLTHPLLEDAGIAHGFGTRTSEAPRDTVRPRQVHGRAVVSATACAAAEVEADAVFARAGDPAVAVVTADCVPILVSDAEGGTVAAIHAGWRGLASGVIEAGLAALGASTTSLRAVVGPHIGPCCYEVDAPVLDALRPRDPDALTAACRESRPEHWWLDLGVLANAALGAAGIPTVARGRVPDACTSCDTERFHSYRRDGPRSGRLVHWIQPRSA
ncbi:MAG: polyphenol oxidase family protein [Myxococcota bacterium]